MWTRGLLYGSDIPSPAKDRNDVKVRLTEELPDPCYLRPWGACPLTQMGGHPWVGGEPRTSPTRIEAGLHRIITMAKPQMIVMSPPL